MIRVTVAQTCTTRQSTRAPLVSCCAVKTKYLHLVTARNTSDPNCLPSSMAFLTARNPSLIASLICVMVCWLGPFTSRVTERGFPHFSMNVYFSSPCKQGPEKSPNVEVRDVTLKRANDSFNVCNVQTRHVQPERQSKSSPVCVRTPTQRFPGTRV